MCYHYSLTKEKVDLEERFDATLEYEWLTQYHVTGFSGQKMPVITAEAPLSIKEMSWGLIPNWVKSNDQAREIRTKGSTLNAKSETAFELPSFRGSIEKKRCLVLADGFFEWMEQKKEKIPHYISLKNRDAFAMAGIYDCWTDRETGEEINSFSILTCDANPLMARIHNVKKRMPLILPKTQERNWLKPDLSKQEIQSLFLPYSEENMQAWTISRMITARNTDTNVPKIIEKVDYIEPLTLF